MKLLLTIAWRNILRHRGKSIIIGVILFLGALLMTIGNGVISGMDRGLEKNIVNGFLGDIVIVSGREKNDNILFKMYGESVEPITNYREIKKVLAGESCVRSSLPVGKNVAMVLNEDDGDPGYTMILGVNIEAYRNFFPDNFVIIEGRALRENETGIIIPKKTREDLYDQMDYWLIPEGAALDETGLTEDARLARKNLVVKSNAVFMGMADINSTTDIRLPVRGIIRYNALNTIWGHFSIMDIESYRQCLGYFSAADSSADITRDRRKLLEMDNEGLDMMFGGTGMIVSDRGNADAPAIDFRRRRNDRREPADPDSGTFNLVLVKLAGGISPDAAVEKLNRSLAAANLGVRAVPWKKASGFIGSMATIIKGALFMFVTFLFFVAIIIIVNTLTMAALERTTEIGMMRAIGARRSFITGMFLGETAILSGIFGGAGIICGTITVKIIPLFGITSSNDLVQLLYGGDVFAPYLSPADLAVVIMELVLVTLITVIYPVKVAGNITPLDAIARD